MDHITPPDCALVEAERAADDSWLAAKAYEKAMGERYLEIVRRGRESSKEGKARKADYLTVVQQTIAWSWVWCIALNKRRGKELDFGHGIAAKARPVPPLPA